MKWNDLLSDLAKAKMKELAERAQQERKKGKIICPPQDEIFRALQLTPPDNVKVVIIGQDPYHTPDQANGLAFSVAPGNPLQPSLRNIFKELQSDIGCGRPTTGDLTPWAERGVLLLNTVLTVEAHKANSHADWGWQAFTGEIFRICSELPQPIVFIAWGRSAEDLVYGIFPKETGWEALMTSHRKTCIFSTHPSPFSATRASSTAPAFVGSRPFSTANKCLEKMDAEPIDWSLP